MSPTSTADELLRGVVVDPDFVRAMRLRPRLLARRLESGKYRRSPEGDLEKRCSKCREYFPATLEFFYREYKDHDTLYAWCKACYCAYRTQWASRVPGRK